MKNTTFLSRFILLHNTFTCTLWNKK